MDPEEFLTHFCDMIRNHTGSTDENEVLYIATACMRNINEHGRVPKHEKLLELVDTHSKEYQFIDELEAQASLRKITDDSEYGSLAKTIIALSPEGTSSRDKLALIQDIGSQLIVMGHVKKDVKKDDIRKAVAKGMLLNQKKIKASPPDRRGRCRARSQDRPACRRCEARSSTPPACP